MRAFVKEMPEIYSKKYYKMAHITPNTCGFIYMKIQQEERRIAAFRSKKIKEVTGFRNRNI